MKTSANNEDGGSVWPVLGGLRFTLAFIVVCHHVVSYDVPCLALDAVANFGALAAILGFFVVSGFSMAHSLSSSPDPGHFYLRRIRRIYPVYLIALLLSSAPMILTKIVFPISHPGISESPSAAQLVIAAFFGQGFLMRELPGNGVLWTLSIEAFLYFLSPILTRCGPWILRGLIVLSALLYVLHNHFDAAVPYFHETRGVAAGCLAWPYLAGFGYYKYRERLCPLPLLLLIGIALTHDVTPDPELLAPLTFGAVLLVVRFADSIRLSQTASRTLSWAGGVSYCLYVVHVPVMSVAHGMSYRFGPGLIGFCLVAAVLTYYLIDLPARGMPDSTRVQKGSVSQTKPVRPVSRSA